jgi:ABC-type multidrug transport system fused ATPase/permease subunit
MFDEPTSSLDQNTELVIMSTIEKWLKSDRDKKTAVFIAHRLSTIRDCDVIFVLDGGKIVESGNHEELLAKGGLYNQMWTSQTH